MLAPVILFVYNRPVHTRKTVEALQKNYLAAESCLYVFSDAARNNNDYENVQEVRQYLKTIDGFKDIFIVEQVENKGLAQSIIGGVTNIINQHGKAIILEDDLVTSPYFLKFMNDALIYYENKKDMWHISGWNYPATFETDQDVYCYRVMDCWGWATWSDRWGYFEKNTDKLITEFSKAEIQAFNLDGSLNLWRQVQLNRSGRINTWAIYWYATIFKHNGMCLNPIKSYVQNIGHDGTGEHCTISRYQDNITLNQKKKIIFIDDIYENTEIIQMIKRYLTKTKISLVKRIINKIKTKMIRLKK